MIVIFIMSMHIDIPCTTKCNTKLTMNLRQCLAKLTLIMQYYDFLQAESCMNHDTNRLKTVNKLYRLIKVFTEKRGSPPPRNCGMSADVHGEERGTTIDGAPTT